MSSAKITVATDIHSDIDTVWNAWNNPADIMQWNTASDDWHTTASTVDLREGGTFSSRMEAKDGSMGFDFSGTYTRVIPNQQIDYVMDDGRTVSIQFALEGGAIRLTETFDAESTYDVEHQRTGWQSILDNFKKLVESR